jgi:hypothetical protein
MRELTLLERRELAYKVRPRDEWEGNTGCPFPYTEQQLDDLGIPRQEPDVEPPSVAAPCVVKRRARRQTTDTLAKHDSETLKHINEVRGNLWKLIHEIDQRGQEHDASKFQEPERTIYADALPELGKTEYGSPEYQKLLEMTKPAIEHHWANNRHHPEHWPNGLEDMDLIDLLEMIADWTAATKRNKNGNIHKSITFNTDRYKISPQLVKILTNTVERYF